MKEEISSMAREPEPLDPAVKHLAAEAEVPEGLVQEALLAHPDQRRVVAWLITVVKRGKKGKVEEPAAYFRDLWRSGGEPPDWALSEAKVLLHPVPARPAVLVDGGPRRIGEILAETSQTSRPQGAALMAKKLDKPDAPMGVQARTVKVQGAFRLVEDA